MSSPASVTGDERLRLFLALQIPDDAVTAIEQWQARELSEGTEGAEGTGRLVPRENMHVTLAFLGSRPAHELPTILRVLGEAARNAAPPHFDVVRWRERRAAGMLELRDRHGTAAAEIARDVQAPLAELGIFRPENRDWLPHVTVLRYRKPPRLGPTLPELEFVPSGVAAFLSRLHPSGALYEVLETFRLNH